jgi:hypothetical protein
MKFDSIKDAVIKALKQLMLIGFLLSVNCNIMKGKQNFYWESLKERFKYFNKNEFVSDGLLEKDISSCYKSTHKSLDSIFPSEKIYLYSWQDRDSTKNEFTVVKDRGELGLKIFYLIMSKDDKLISVTDIAGAGSEAYIIFETRSKFISKDSILQIRTITQWLDPDTQKKMDRTKSDSTFSYLIIDSSGKVTENMFKEVKGLNFMNE